MLLHPSGLLKILWGEAAWHVVWLLNHTSTKAVEGITPFEAAFGRKPNLQHVHEWGEKVWVHIKKGNKLGKRVKGGRWLGIDECSKGYWIYWPNTRAVTVKCNVYHNEACQPVDYLEGENWDFKPTTKAMPSPDVPTPRVPAPELATPTIASTENPETCPPSPAHQDPPEDDAIPVRHTR